MKMVAASKLKKAQNAVIEARPYALKMNEVLEHILSHADLAGHPLLLARVPKRVEILILSSDRGLCGSFNANIIRTAENYIKDNQDKYEEIIVSTIGRKAKDHFPAQGHRHLRRLRGRNTEPHLRPRRRDRRGPRRSLPRGPGRLHRHRLQRVQERHLAARGGAGAPAPVPHRGLGREPHRAHR